MQLVIIGTNGLVGQEFINLIKNNYFYNNFLFIGSEKSKGLSYIFRNIDYIINTLANINWSNDYVFINCADKEQACEIKNKMSLNSILIDNSSQFRLTNEVPLVIPEINFPNKRYQIYANPNCSTIILNLLMKPLDDNFGIKRVIVSTYQAASGAGKLGIDELQLQTGEKTNNKELTTNFWKKQYIYNTFVHNSDIQDNNYNEEENKIMNETNKIFNKNIPISATAIRVPVLRSHCESVNIELKNKTSYDEILSILLKMDYLEILDNKAEKIFPESITSNNKKKVQVGHIREDFSLEKGYGWNFWISADQLLRGAAYNAYLILEQLKN